MQDNITPQHLHTMINERQMILDRMGKNTGRLEYLEKEADIENMETDIEIKEMYKLF